MFLGLGAGIALGWIGGGRLLGTLGSLVGAIVFSYAGLLVGRLPEILVLRMLWGKLAVLPSDELRSFLRRATCPIPSLVLLELRRRGEDMHQELGVILDLLGSETIAQRGHGWAALTSVFPDLACQLADYHVGGSVADCRNQSEKVRREWLETSAG
jgi:hypothetical protein